MKKQLIAATVISAILFSHTSWAVVAEPQKAREHTEELVGLSSGILLGAVIAGPVGAIIGAFTGTIIGKTVGDEAEIADKNQQLVKQKHTLVAQQQQLIAMDLQQQELVQVSEKYYELQTNLAELNANQQRTLNELTIGMNVQFKTGSSQIEPLFKQQLDNVAYMMTLSPELTIDLTGYADRRGDDQYNQALSEQRLAEVIQYLVLQGIDRQRLQGRAYGATSPLHTEQNIENDFFDRRVTLTLMSPAAQLAAN
ncbi:sortase-associated OmpA-like protein PdsO [Shewanella inventionis]|uniref:Membrane protein n=1 Tax=Shewanella inventionis TaxID=1738770 RepID=A0ABQ1JRJ9_9GAMM|nr:sortase-associated OmpA-like protein PdsO [Shewanella inventionis]MCL1159332.1 sortase-associated OmpA-like protein PdsO [Shewanella inventionis]GGB72862.1 membrane protein [Shewanella inventionis]